MINISYDEGLSLGEEMMIGECALYYSQLAHNENLAKNGIWINKSGESIKICDMSNSYIQNCINWIRKNEETLLDCYIPIFELELKRR